MRDLPPLKRVLFSLVLFFIICLFLELGSFLVWNNNPEGSRRNTIKFYCGESDLNVRYLPNAFWRHDLNPAYSEYRGTINSHGTKGAEFDVPKPLNEFRIILVGDSTIEGINLPPAQTVPACLQSLFASKTSVGQHISVINAGISSHNSAFTLNYLALRLIHFQPDLIVLKSSYNDTTPFMTEGMKVDYTHVYKEPYCLSNSTNFYWKLARYSYFLKVLGFVFFKDEVDRPISSFLGEQSKTIPQFDFSSNESRFYVYKENIRSMILLCKGRNIPIYVLDLPTNPTMDQKIIFPAYREAVRRLEKELQAVTQEERVPFVRNMSLTDKDFWDHCHNTFVGNQKIASAIFENIRNDSRLKPLITDSK